MSPPLRLSTFPLFANRYVISHVAGNQTETHVRDKEGMGMVEKYYVYWVRELCKPAQYLGL